jgi:hypothetical protein
MDYFVSKYTINSKFEKGGKYRSWPYFDVNILLRVSGCDA